jgi:hypothetical protein
MQKVQEPWLGSRLVLEEVAARHRSDFWVQFEIGYFFRNKDPDPTRAVGLLRAASALRPDCGTALELLGGALSDGQDLDGAIAASKEMARK